MKIKILIPLAAFLLLTGVALAYMPPPISIDRYVVSGGGGHLVAGSYALDNTIGQAVVGAASAGQYSLCSGFWCDAGAEIEIDHYLYLPLTMRD